MLGKLLICGAALLLMAGQARAETIEDKVQVCTGCHGENGKPVDKTIPTIWGQQAGYLYIQLRDFKRGDRKSEIMQPIATEFEKDGGGQEQAVLTAVTELVNNHPNGVTGLIAQLQTSGTGGVAQASVDGANPAPSADLLQSIVGSSAVSELAGKIGVSPEQASSVLAQVLPLVLHHGTAGGQVPQGGQIDSANVIESIQKAGGLATLAQGYLEKKEG